MSQLVPFVVLVLAWLFLRWRDQQRAADMPATASGAPKQTGGMVKFVIALLIFGFAFQGYQEWSDERAVAKARAAMTPAQRAAVDAAESQRAANQARQTQRDAQEQQFRSACARRLLATLHDPDAAQISWSSSSVNNAGVFTGIIEGRAKNAFGALIRASWLCEAAGQGNAIVVTSISQLSP